MPAASRNTPKYKIKIDGQLLPAAVASALREITVDRTLDGADGFVLTLQNDRCRLSDDASLKPGKKVEIELGYEEGGGQTTPVLDGEITAVKAVFPRRGALAVKLQGYTKHHRLQRGRFTRTWKDKTYSAIATAIASEVGLEPDGEATSPALEYVFQRNQTNLEFLLEIAGRVGYEVFVGEGKLHFRKPKEDGASTATLKKGEGLLSFHPEVRAARVPVEVKVQGFDSAAKQAFKGTATGADAGPDLGGRTNAAAVVAKLGTPLPKAAIHQLGLKDQAQADAIAKAALRAAAQDLVHAEATVAGAPELQPGSVVEIDGVGDIFSGLYYVRGVHHSYHREGFATTLSLRRSAIEKEPAAPPPPAPSEPSPEQAAPPARPGQAAQPAGPGQTAPGPAAGQAAPPAGPGQAPPGSSAPPAPPVHAVAARVVDQVTQEPLSDVEFEILDEAGTVVKKGKTDWQGTVYHAVAAPGNYKVRIAGPPTFEGLKIDGQPCPTFDEGSLKVVQAGFDESSLKVVVQPTPGFDEGSLKVVQEPAPGFDETSLKVAQAWFDESSLRVVQEAPPGFDENTLRVVQEAPPGFDETSLRVVAEAPPSLDVGSLVIVPR